MVSEGSVFSRGPRLVCATGTGSRETPGIDPSLRERPGLLLASLSRSLIRHGMLMPIDWKSEVRAMEGPD